MEEGDEGVEVGFELREGDVLGRVDGGVVCAEPDREQGGGWQARANTGEPLLRGRVSDVVKRDKWGLAYALGNGDGPRGCTGAGGSALQGEGEVARRVVRSALL